MQIKVKLISLLGFLVTITQQSSKALPQTFTSTFSDCEHLQSLLKCTMCGNSLILVTRYPYNNQTSTPYQDYETVTCNFPGICPDGVIRSVCTWQRLFFHYCF